ncbi:cytochrome P450 3A8-like [Oppia nitens]|uniref:cytochrome P450 3A8-like n=1 Tax=Oppia nitens TaxID=1686743 RepID=UPI0023DB1902|nr:cytochrome P450 3A8-like [Oppia nitens]
MLQYLTNNNITILSLNPLTIVLILFSILYAIYRYYYSTNGCNHWEAQGVKTVSFGLWTRMTTKWYRLEQELYRKYGKCFGVYEGNRPVLYLADPELIRDVLVKDFHVFTNRRDVRAGFLMNKMIANLKDDDWKRVRTVISPTFTSGKLRKMLPLITDCLKTLNCMLETASLETGQPYDMKTVYCGYTMEVILQVSFGVKVDAMLDKDNPIILNAGKLLAHEFRSLYLTVMFLPKLADYLQLSVFDESVIEFFHDFTLKVIADRRNLMKQIAANPNGRYGKKRVDFLQLMLDSADSNNNESMDDMMDNTNTTTHTNTMDDEKYGEYDKQTNNSNVTKKYLSNDELIASCVVFFVAGFENTITTLSIITYLLAANPDCQQRLYEEVVNYFSNQSDEQEVTDYEALNSMEYLDSVIKETLRLYPNSQALEREAGEDYRLGGPNGISIKKGQLVHILNYAMQHDGALYPEPEQFRPERFSKANQTSKQVNPYAYLPFGGGPRNCVGMRLAQIVIKLAIINAVYRYKFYSTGKPLEFYNYQVFGIMTPKNVCVRVEKRQQN